MPKNIFTGMKRWGLRELNSSFVKDIPKQLQEKKNARLDNIFLTIVVLYIIVVLGYYPVLTVLGIGTQSTILYSLGFVLVVFGIVSVYYALRVYFYYLGVRNTPVSSIDLARKGLNEFKVRFFPESGPSLISPASKRKCVYFKLEEHEVVGSGKNGDVVIASSTKAVPAILGDDTGYLAVDFTNISLEMQSEKYKPIFKDNVKMKFQENMDRSKNELQSIENMPASSFDDMYAIWQKEQENNLKTMTEGIDFVRGEGYGSVPQPNSTGSNVPERKIYFVEYVLALDKDYFALGEVSDLDKRISRKEVKFIHADPNYQLFSLLPDEKRAWIEKDYRTFISLFAFGFINVIVGLTLGINLIILVI